MTLTQRRRTRLRRLRNLATIDSLESRTRLSLVLISTIVTRIVTPARSRTVTGETITTVTATSTVSHGRNTTPLASA
jgi:hypothetical protein